VAFDTLPAPLVPGTRGTARIATEPMPLGRHTLRWLAQTFRVPI
jgi:hypothetical protein